MHTSSVPDDIQIPHRITITVQYLSRSSWTKDHGTVLKSIKRCTPVIVHSVAMKSSWCVQSAVYCLVNFAFITNKPNISHKSIVPKWSVWVLCQMMLAFGPCDKHVSLYLSLRHMLNRSTVGITSSDQMHLKGWALVDLKTPWPQIPLCYC